MKYASKLEDEIISATSIAELLEIKKQVENIAFTERDSEYLLQLIEMTIEHWQ